MIQIRQQWQYSATSKPAKIIHMPGGEVHPQLGDIEADSYKMIADTRNSTELFEILMVHNALKRLSPGAPIDLVIGYVPYARQDRISAEGEALSIEAMADFLNMMQFRSVTIVDPHSDVTPALIKNCRVITQFEIIDEHLLGDRHSGYQQLKIKPAEWVLVCPDQGAIKKTNKLCSEAGFAGIVYMDKHRDTETGKITGTYPRQFNLLGENVPIEQIAGKKLLIVDDICDGGFTFIQIAKALRAYELEQLDLFVTHGLFTKGTQVLKDAGIDRIMSTNTYGMESWNAENYEIKDDVIAETGVIRFRVLSNI